MPSVKHFAPKRDVKAAPVVEFSIDFIRDGVAELHEFSARPRTSYGDVLGLVKNQDDDNGKALPHLDAMIRRCLLNDDGVPQKWKPVIEDGHFTAPNGDRTLIAELPKFVTFEAGSSRRRWVQLIEHDGEVEVELDQIAGVFEYLAETAGKDRT